LPKELTDLDICVVLAYAENNMNVVETGRKMFMHRNTIQYHLDVARKKTGLCPMKFFDLVKLVETLRERRGEDV
jgi:sugar diacid utilization regulator